VTSVAPPLFVEDAVIRRDRSWREVTFDDIPIGPTRRLRLAP
jgi:hypothetical protein